MGNISFRPNKGKKVNDLSKPQSIYLRYSLGRKLDFNASIGFSVLMDDWDKVKQRVKNRVSISNRYEINNLISKLTQHFESFENKNLEHGYTPNYEEVRKHFDSYFNSSEKQEHNLFSFIEEFIERSETQPNPVTGKKVSSQTIRSYKVTRNILKRFNDEKYKIDFDKIRLTWYHDFLEWCNEQGLTKNYIGKHIKTLKTFMSEAVEYGFTDNTEYKNRRFITLKEEADNIYLTEEELLRIYQLDLSKEPNLDRARDLFLIGAYTGLRVSDYNRLTERNIIVRDGRKFFEVKTSKTSQRLVIPIHPIALMVLEKNGGNPPRYMPDQTINKHIKVVCENAGIDEVEYKTQTRGGLEVTEKKQRFELVANHTARRSFCTNAYLSGLGTLEIMSISGHKTESAFMKYIKVTPEQVAIRLSEHPFFQGKQKLIKIS